MSSRVVVAAALIACSESPSMPNMPSPPVFVPGFEGCFPNFDEAAEDPRLELLSDGLHGLPYVESLALAVAELPEAACSGVWISPRHLASAGHCYLGPRSTVAQMRGPEGMIERSVTARFSLRSDLIVDLAVYELASGEPEVEHWIPLDLADAFVSNEEVRYFALGVPSRNERGQQLLIGPASGLGFEDPAMFRDRIESTREDGTIPIRAARYSPDDTFVSLSGLAEGGMSGGPVVRIESSPAGCALSIAGQILGGSSAHGGQNLRASSIRDLQHYLTHWDPELLEPLGLPASPRLEPADAFFAPGRDVVGTVRRLELVERTLSGVIFFGLDVQDDCRLEGVSFDGAVLHATDLSKCSAIRVQMNGTVFSTEVQWPAGFTPDPAVNLGPIAFMRRFDEPPAAGAATDFADRVLDGVYVPHWLDLTLARFDGASLVGAFIQAENDGASFASADLTSANVRGPHRFDAVAPAFTGADLRGVNVGSSPGSSLGGELSPSFAGATFDRLSNVPGLAEQPFYRDLGGPSRPRAGFELASADPIPRSLEEPYRSAWEALGPRREWSAAESERVNAWLDDWTLRFPLYMGALDGVHVRLLRTGAWPDFLETAPYAVAGLTNAWTGELRHDRVHAPYASLDIYLTDRAAQETLEIEGVPRFAFTVFHELSHAIDRTESPLARPNLTYAAPPDSYLSDCGFTQPDAEVDEAWRRYLELKRTDDAAALAHSRAFATARGMPSIYSMLCIPTETDAELLTYAALDPTFDDYTPPELAAAVRRHLAP